MKKNKKIEKEEIRKATVVIISMLCFLICALVAGVVRFLVN